MLFGLGPPVAFTGPYVKIITAAGITKAAMIGAGLGDPQCRAVQIKFDFGGGWGIQLRSAWKEGLEKLLGKRATAEWEVVEYTATSVDRSSVRR